MLTEMGIKNEELPPISTEDSEETRGFPNEPMPLEDLHRQKGKHNETCSWRNIGRTKGVVPKLDRYMNSLKRIKTLIVHDPDGVIPSSRHSATDKSIRYCQRDAKRLNVPWVEPPPEENAMVAHLHLSRSKKLGSGNAGEVFQATFDIPHIIADEMFWYCCHETGKGGKDFEPCDYVANASGDLNLDGIPTRFTVAAKISHAEGYQIKYLLNEAKMYANFQPWLTLDFSGYQVVSPIHVPQAACALVPKSYGCWVPEVINSKMSNGYPVNRYNVESLSPILLLEECGRPTVEGGLSGNEKKLWWSMLLRFHRHGFVQRSIYPRNLLVQPGPLTAAPEERSMKRPSFRLIDFGRGLVRSEEKETEHCFTEFKEAIAKDQKNLVALLGLGREESFDGFLSPP
ncbi:hypothetical protein FRB95_003047 [Tulasnella sp. JGI-2019a]|nr:hypothetical protein FRB95_003047 [Tulasnella sp. JGI-2019a]